MVQYTRNNIWVNTGDSYIGSAVNLSKRLNVYCIEEVRSESHIAIQKYGDENLYCDTTETTVREQYYIDFFYILPTANSSLGRKHSEETK